jgi:hypothetical protein
MVEHIVADIRFMGSLTEGTASSYTST